MSSSFFFGGKATLVPLAHHRDERGTLLPIELESLPFKPCRVFAIGDVPAGTTRGRHAHECGRQLLICLAGNVQVELRWQDQSAIVNLEALGEGLLVEAGVWAAQTYLVPGTVLLGLASDPHESPDESG